MNFSQLITQIRSELAHFETFDTEKESHLHVPVLEQHDEHVENWIDYITNDYFCQMQQLIECQEHDPDCECYWCRY